MGDVIDFRSKKSPSVEQVSDKAKEPPVDSTKKFSVPDGHKFAVVYSNIPTIMNIDAEWVVEEDQYVKTFETMEEAKVFSTRVLDTIAMIVMATHCNPARPSDVVQLNKGPKLAMLVEHMLNM